MSAVDPVSGFTKLFESIIHSTVWETAMHVKITWVTMLAMADRNGHVSASVPGLAKAAGVSLKQVIDALNVLSSPDKWSRTKTNEGRRIEPIDGGWRLLNYLKYREQRDSDERRIQTREAVARHRAKKAAVSHGKPQQAQAEAEAEKIKRQDQREAAPVSLREVRRHLKAACYRLMETDADCHPSHPESGVTLFDKLKHIAAYDLKVSDYSGRQIDKIINACQRGGK